MSVRRRSLPPGWYPGGKGATLAEIEGFERGLPEAVDKACAGVAPHAGWTFSGQVALEVLRCFPRETQTVVVVGGHMHPGSGVVAAPEEGYETPLGVIPADLELLETLKTSLEILPDREPDNTVEIQLPLIRYLFPQARCLALRAAPSQEALVLGEALAGAGRRAGTQLCVLGSTDLTHYGPNYGFSPRGSGPQALAWVREVNDRRFIEAMVDMRLEEALEAAARHHCACSAGGAVAAARFAALQGCGAGRLLDYRTSHDLYPGDSFVGYAGIIYPLPA
ncbi:MAG: AmmeMemoRadiSam system protein B [Spirochaetales bacterium]|nr:AmmeMemoRadiSam system protein B [Spirochaetales bacterium]